MHTAELLKHASLNYKKDALISCHQGITYSYQELYQRSYRIASAFYAIGLRPGDRIGIYSTNSAEWVVTQFASSFLDLILVNVNPAFKSSELRMCLENVGIKTLVMNTGVAKNDYIRNLAEAVPEFAYSQTKQIICSSLPKFRNVVLIDDKYNHNNTQVHSEHKNMYKFSELYQFNNNNNSGSEVDTILNGISNDNITNIQFTSGTTGFPKGASLSHKTIVNNGKFIAQYLKYTPDDIVNITVPLYHCFGMVLGNLACVNSGATMVYHNDSFDPLKALQVVQKYKTTSIYGVPTMFYMYLDVLKQQKFETDCIRTGIMAGAICPESLLTRLNKEMSIPDLTVAYGMTETGPVTFQIKADDPFIKKTTTAGMVHPHVECKIIDHEGNVVPRNTPGEICTKGYNNMKFYWKDPIKTKQTLQEDGFVHSGDQGVIDDDGYLSIVGRVKDMIIRGGENIYPKEIEEFLGKQPGIKELYVIGVADEKFGEEVCVWYKKAEDNGADYQDLFDICKQNLAHYKVPKFIRVVDTFPMTITGKIQKNIMRDISNQILKESPLIDGKKGDIRVMK